MAKGPLYPHVPKKKEPLFPHVPKGSREAWQMTGAEYEASLLARRPHMTSIERLQFKRHGMIVQEALDEGKPVPTEVLAEYPYLVERQAKDKIARDSFGKAYEELGPERQLGVDLAYLRNQKEPLSPHATASQKPGPQFIKVGERVRYIRKDGKSRRVDWPEGAWLEYGVEGVVTEFHPGIPAVTVRGERFEAIEPWAVFTLDNGGSTVIYAEDEGEHWERLGSMPVIRGK